MINIPTVITAVIIAALFILIVANQIRKLRKGIHGCSCGCSSCSSSSYCNSQNKNIKK